ncbi:hypothetical protein [Caulobacter endophyticus]|uniref:hypothetical protein n=1 Tax=Caulobacter endophyticus TaxID=2172652 RepID=UPI00241017C7|nr:hypothetical protein [Caulobacter endophyticus]MDG2528213.1 hypothetical protein [Caulobacter endophyticus]
MTDNDRGLSLASRIASVVWFLLGVGFLLSLPPLIELYAWIPLAILALAAVLAVPVAAVTRFVLDRARRKSFLAHWLKASVALLLVLTTLAAAPLYYLAAIVQTDPLLAPQVVLTNGKKTILFQGMMHIGSDTFYKTAIYDLEHALNEGYVAYYEGVRPDPAGDVWFRDTLAGGGDLNAIYGSAGKACGLAFQGPYFQLLKTDIQDHPNRHVAADVTTLDLKTEYERMIAADPKFADAIRQAREADKKDAGIATEVAGFVRWAEDGTPGHRSIAGVLCRGVLTYALGDKHSRDKDDPMNRLILDYRNRQLVARIEADPRQKIYINYGAAHLPGLLAMLRQGDPNWKVVSEKWSRVVEPPEDLQGRPLN